MILLSGAILGLLVGLGLARRAGLPYEAPVLRQVWLVLTAFLLQWWERSTETPIIASQAAFITFTLLNWRFKGMRMLLCGAALNLLVMASNGGFMPISFETAGRLTQIDLLDYPAGTLFGAKDILLPPEQTRFEWLADRYLPPVWLPYQFAFSLGDIFIATGAFWLLAWQNTPMTQKGETL